MMTKLRPLQQYKEDGGPSGATHAPPHPTLTSTRVAAFRPTPPHPKPTPFRPARPTPLLPSPHRPTSLHTVHGDGWSGVYPSAPACTGKWLERIFLATNGDEGHIKLGVLPSGRYLNGHTYFVQVPPSSCDSFHLLAPLPPIHDAGLHPV